MLSKESTQALIASCTNWLQNPVLRPQNGLCYQLCKSVGVGEWVECYNFVGDFMREFMKNNEVRGPYMSHPGVVTPLRLRAAKELLDYLTNTESQ